MLITFEGIDASGKTTQMDLLVKTLEKSGVNLITTRQPGGTPIGQAIRKILLDPSNTELVPESEVLLYMADRLQHINQVIKPALSAGKIVLCDRYHDATLAYQGAGRKLDLSWLTPIQEKFIPVPDLTLWFDISVACSQTRLRERNRLQQTENCRLESENYEFFERIRSAYRSVAESEPHRFTTIAAENAVQVVQQQVEQIVMKRIKENR